MVLNVTLRISYITIIFVQVISTAVLVDFRLQSQKLVYRFILRQTLSEHRRKKKLFERKVLHVKLATS